MDGCCDDAEVLLGICCEPLVRREDYGNRPPAPPDGGRRGLRPEPRNRVSGCAFPTVSAVPSLPVRAVSRAPGLKRLPLLKVLAIAEIALLARDHVSYLEPSERRRLLTLVRKGKARNSRNLSKRERAELTELVAKAEPRRFAGLVADKLSPVPLPKRVVNGPRRR